jgi:hypothetical protein
MRRRPLRCISLALCALAFGCDDDLQTELEQVDLSSNLHSYSAPWSSHEIVEGSTVCATYTGYRTKEGDSPQFEGAEDAEIRACYDERVTGPAELDTSGCISLPGPGRATWELTRKSCALPDTFGDDQVIFDVVPVADVRGAFRYAVPPPRMFFDGTEVDGVDALPDGYTAEVGDPVRVIEDRLGSISTMVVRRDAPVLVAVTDPVVVGTAVAGSPMVTAPGTPSLDVAVTARAGDVIDVTIELPAGELPVGEVEVVARTEIASMTLHPVVLRVADTDSFLELGATAITRDAEGRVLREPPVEWKVVEGSAELVDANDDGVADPGPSASITDACGGARRGEQRFAVLEGRIDDHQGTVRVEWDCVDAPEEGCACRARPEASGSAWLLVLALCGGLRRRRTR